MQSLVKPEFYNRRPASEVQPRHYAPDRSSDVKASFYASHPDSIVPLAAYTPDSPNAGREAVRRSLQPANAVTSTPIAPSRVAAIPPDDVSAAFATRYPALAAALRKRRAATDKTATRGAADASDTYDAAFAAGYKLAMEQKGREAGYESGQQAAQQKLDRAS